MVWRLIGSQSNLQVGECQKWHATTALLEGSARIVEVGGVASFDYKKRKRKRKREATE